MTEYSTSSEAYHTYHTARDRTNRWLEELDGVQFHSPGVSPLRLYNESESGEENKRSSLTTIESSHSIPPRLYLRYGDGRPKEPIPLMYNSTQKHAPSKQHSRPSDIAPHHHHHSSSKPHYSRRVTDEELYEPELIRVLPSHSGSMSRSTQHTRSKSLPRDAYGESNPVFSHGVPPPLPAQRIISQPIYPPHNSTPQRISPRSSSQAQQGPASRGRNPPSIVYAPSGHSARQPRYQPPLIYSHPPTVGPNGVVYSHSAPSKQQTTPSVTTRGPPPPHSSRDGERRPRSKSETRSKGGAKSFDEPRSRSRSRGGVYAEGSTPTASTPSLASDNSGSTYYVLPTGKQKIHVIVSVNPFATR